MLTRRVDTYDINGGPMELCFRFTVPPQSAWLRMFFLRPPVQPCLSGRVPETRDRS